MPAKRNAQAARSTVVRTAKKGSRRLRGKGDYSTDITGEPDIAVRLEKKIDHLEKSLVHATPSYNKAASMAGRALGTAFGQGDLGALAGEKLSKLFGFGDYRTAIKGNSLMVGTTGPTVPKFAGDGRRGTRITEREFLGNIVSSSTLVSGSSTFNNSSYPIIPTSTQTFPWLSNIAVLFDQWEPHGIVFEFVTTSSTFNGSSQALGAVVMATDYDVNDPLFTTKQQMENSDFACSTVPSNNLLHGIECDPRERPLDVMYTNSRPGQLNFSTLGNFQLATQGMSTAGTTLGELWISYDITFYKKVLETPLIEQPQLNANSSSVVGGPIIIPTNYPVSTGGVTINQLIGTGTQFLFPPQQSTGKYLFYMTFGSAPQAPLSLLPTGTAAHNCTCSATFTAGGVSVPSVLMFTVTLSGPNALVTFPLQQITASVNQVGIIQVDPAWVY